MRRCFYAASFFFLCGALSAAVAQQTPQQDQVVNPVPIEIKKSADTFEYQIEGRPDPFLPFITERASSNENPDEIVDRDQVLTGMQLFEPGQLTLVALMVAGSNKYAMVQDFTGKGYVIEEGTKIGRRGVVADIVENRIIIEEQALTRGGKTLINKIAMVLKKEGEE
ncbi:MAG: pilus assembly protein PilP [Desulfocapsaceae bacterium]|nr:pilus assembly protein PilP [Desulfocapsaceae bacterium]